MKKPYLLVLFLVWPFFGSLSDAARPPRKKPNSLPAIQRAIDRGEWSTVLALSRPVQSKPETTDLGLSLEARALRELSLKDLTKKNIEAVGSKGRRLHSLANRLREEVPQSSYTSEGAEWTAFGDWLLGAHEMMLKHDATAAKFFCRGFARISTSKVLPLLSFDLLKFFLASLKKKPTDDAKFWLRKIAGVYPKDSIEAGLIRELSPAGILDVNFAPPVVMGRLSQKYTVPDPDQVAFDEAMAIVLKPDLKGALDKLLDFNKLYPRSTLRSRALYWVGMSYLARDKKDEARVTFEELTRTHPLSYYGVLSALALHKDPDASLGKEPPRTTLEDPYAEPQELERIRKARNYIDSSVPGFAQGELKDFTPRKNLSNEFLFGVSELATEAHAHLAAFRVMAELVQRMAPGVNSTWAFDIYYPLTEWEMIQKIAKEQGVDPILVMSLTKQESSFQSRITSGSGAIGFMQLMPFTAVGLDKTIEQRQIFESERNVRLGSRYLGDLIKRFDGNYALALAGYNAGPHRVDRWLKEGNAKWNQFEFIESIPFKETKDYVSSIMRNYYWYSYKIRGVKLASFDLFWQKVAKVDPLAKPVLDEAEFEDPAAPPSPTP